MGNWVKIRYPTQRKVFIDGNELGSTNRKQFIGEPGTFWFDLGEPLDYKPKRMRRRIEGTSRRRPLEIDFEPLRDDSQ